MIVAFNLINFDSNKIDGVGYYIKRILGVIQDRGEGCKYILLIPDDFCIETLGVNDVNFNVIQFRVPKNKLSRLVFKFIIYPRMLSKINVDLIYSPAPPISPFINKEIKLVTTIHDLTPLHIDRGQGFIYRFYYWLIVKIAINKSDYLTTVSNNSLADICKKFPDSAIKTSIVTNFIAGKKLEYCSDEDFFVFISTIQPGKNLERLIEAFNIFLKTNGRDFKLYVVGREGWGSENILNLPKNLNIESSVIFTGYIDEKQLDELYRKCSAIIYPSLYEGFGLPPLEAMYYGKPSVVSNTSSLPEVVGEAGILVDPYDIYSISNGMIKIIDRDERMRLIKNIPTQLDKFDSKLQVNKLIEIFKRVCEENTNNKRI
jgi:glycosyltransferase involved in cell wall biosynthesis